MALSDDPPANAELTKTQLGSHGNEMGQRTVDHAPEAVIESEAGQCSVIVWRGHDFVEAKPRENILEIHSTCFLKTEAATIDDSPIRWS